MSRPSTRGRTLRQGHDRPGGYPADPRPWGDHPAARRVPRGRHGRVREPRRMREREGGLGAERVAGQRVRRFDDPGLRHVDERQRRRHHPLQGQVDRLGLPHRHLPARLLPGQRRATAAGQCPPDREPAPDPARLPDRLGDGPHRLRQLGRVGVVDGPVHRGLRRLHRQAHTRRQRGREPDPVRGARRRGALRHAGEDLRLHVAGLQQVRRQQPVLVHLPCPPGNPNGYKAAFSVSYNRPFDGTITQDNGRSYLFYAEYQMIRFLERNGYDASYTSQGDVAANAGLLLNHKVILSSGHDEYWSGQERTNVEAARDAGVSLAFFSGNEVYWKTRWQSSSADGTATANRTLTTYKDTHFDAPTDPTAWTGTWRDPRFAAVGDSRPENALTGQLFIINSGSSDITVPSTYKNLRLWRNTAVANLGAGQSRTLGAGDQTLGYEWDLDVDNGFRPRGSFRVSSTTVSGVESFTDFGTFTKQGTTQTHNMTEYKTPSGAIVFGAGTVQWAWGLDDTNAWNNNGPPAGATPDPVMQQATVNLFADMGVPATTLMSGLTAVSQSTDTTAPNSTISSPSAGAAVADGSTVTISGTASDAGGQVAGIEVSTDGGSTWHPATGTTSWSYSWNAHGSPTATIMSRATDDSGNVESSSPSATVNVGCPCTMQGSNTTPWTLDEQDVSPVEVGVRFKADLDGIVTGVRFYKATANTGSHVGSLWTNGGTLLAT